MAEPCCCYYGAAVAGEWPEFECTDCPVHQGGLEPEFRCRRHAHLAAGHERFQFANGTAWVHGRAKCTPPCAIHSPSDHSMREWPLVLRETALVERTCPHGIGHPDPDSVAYMRHVTGESSWGIHGCDGCCARLTATALFGGPAPDYRLLGEGEFPYVRMPK